jgi:SAM-dependent methyltransferase
VSTSIYSHPRLYDRLFPPGAYAPFYADRARREGGPVLELACGTGQLIVPIARSGVRATGIDLSAEMLEAARDRARAASADVDLVEGDMRDFDLDERFGLVYVARNSLLHLHETDDLLACFGAVRRHLRPGGAFVFDVFNPSVRLLAIPAGKRFEVMRVLDPERGEITIEQAGDYDAAAQVNRATWYFSAPGASDFLAAPLHLRSIFPRELPLLLSAGGFRLESRHGDFSGAPFAGDSRHQVCVCRAA